jgi:hypothetical protein
VNFNKQRVKVIIHRACISIISEICDTFLSNAISQKWQCGVHQFLLTDIKNFKSLQLNLCYMCSLHGLVRGENMELGRDSDTGGQVGFFCFFLLFIISCKSNGMNSFCLVLLETLALTASTLVAISKSSGSNATCGCFVVCAVKYMRCISEM